MKMILRKLCRIRPLNIIMLTVAGIINAFGVTVFLSPVKLYDSGISVSSLCCFTMGIIIALSLSLPAGATVVMIYLALLIICFAIKTVRTAFENSRSKGRRVIKSE